jgi:multidrug resistance protein MdtO
VATIRQGVQTSLSSLLWFWGFLKEELAPHPGRAALVARMVAASTLVMIICMTFRIAYGFQGAIFTLLVSRENPRATVRSAGTILLFTASGAAYILISAQLVISLLTLHLLWVLGSFWLAFYALRSMSSNTAATMFVIMIAVGVPLWDRHVSAETNVEDTLRVTLAASVGVLVTALTDLVFVHLSSGAKGDDIVLPVAERLAAIESLLACYASGNPVDGATETKVVRLGMAGTSMLRRTLFRSSYSRSHVEQMGAVVALVGRLVDIGANLTLLGIPFSDSNRTRFRRLAETVARIRSDLVRRRAPHLIDFAPERDTLHAVPLLSEMESTVSLIPEVFAGPQSLNLPAPSPLNDEPPPALLLRDALSNVEHLRFALKGCLTAGLCYIVYTAIDWQAISTSVTTCLLTALSTIGSSRQKQILRFAGAVTGGFVMGMGSQVFILTHLDSIGGFTVLFVLVTAVACWFMTSSPRLSYCGMQMALAFYLINLQEFAMQTSLSVARDRVVGILFGIFMMWLVFDQLWGASAVVEMKRTFISSLRLLAQYAREPLSQDMSVVAARDNLLRERITNSFDQVRALADGVLLEFGPSRQQDLVLRRQIVRWQPRLRLLFITEIALLKYRVQVPGFELPDPIATTQHEFDDNLAMVLEGMAERMEGRTRDRLNSFTPSLEHLERALRPYLSEQLQPGVAARFQTFLFLSRRIESLTLSLDKEI